MEKQEQYKALVERYLKGIASAADIDALLIYFGVATEPELKAVIAGVFEHDDANYSLDEETKLHVAGLYDAIAEMVNDKQPVKQVKLWPRIAVAAAAVAVITLGLWFYQQNQPQKSNPQNSALVKSEIIPGKQGATLTLASGKKIRLGRAANGELAKEAGIVITKSANGQLVYKVAQGGAGPNKTNTLSTARGETYEVRLPDGTLVWLNAASSLTYATRPDQQNERRVKLEGEGYFEVAKDKDHPFIVETRGHQVEVLGTHFNISSYHDDEVEKTTLLEGSIRLRKGANVRVLRPGQEASIKGTYISVKEVDTDFAVAWKNNEFTFESEGIENIMKAVERWYNVEVIYVGEKTSERFTGGVSRFDNISKVLGIVEATGASHFKVAGRKIYVSK